MVMQGMVSKRFFQCEKRPPPALRATPASVGQGASGVPLMSPFGGGEGEDEKPLNNTPSCHSGVDPESRKHLITLDTGLRRYDDVDGFFTITTRSSACDSRVRWRK